MLSAGMFSALAAAIAPRRRGFLSGSPPAFAAMVISLIRRVKILPRFASRAPFLCLMVAHFEWPDMVNLVSETLLRRIRPWRRSGCLETMQANTNYSMWVAQAGIPPRPLSGVIPHRVAEAVAEVGKAMRHGAREPVCGR